MGALANRDVGRRFVSVCSWFRAAFVSLLVSARILQTRDIIPFHSSIHIVNIPGHFQRFFSHYLNYGYMTINAYSPPAFSTNK
jgi:hypothetical protein